MADLATNSVGSTQETSVDPLNPNIIKLKSDFSDYNKFKPKFDKMVGEFDSKIGRKVDENRKIRHLTIKPNELRETGAINKSETMIGIRVVDRNIEVEIPPYINYLTKSPRVGIFKDLDDPKSSNDLIESDFTTAIKYEGWIEPIHRMLDASKNHGYNVLEVNFESANPGRISFFDIGTENCIFPVDAISLQACPIIGIRMFLSATQLESLRDSFGFNEIAVRELLDKRPELRFLDLFEVYKVYYKEAGAVSVCWYSKDCNSTYLKNPIPFDNGVRIKKVTQELDYTTGAITTNESWDPLTVKDYPLFLLPYKVTEDKRIANLEGRALLDESKQEAQTVIWSSFVNTTVRASNVYCSPDVSVEPGLNVELLDTVLENGRVYNQPLRFFSSPFPPVDLVRAVNALDVKSQEELGQVSYAVNNRVDSRKTAHEVEAAEKQNAMLDVVTVVLFSAWWQRVLGYCWNIIQSHALMGTIKFVQVDTHGAPDPLTGQPSVSKVNDQVKISHNFIILPAGDSDVIEREQTLLRRKEYWEFVVNFPPLAMVYLADMLKEAFPEYGLKYEAILQQMGQMATEQGDNFKQLALGLYQMLESLIQDPNIAAKPEVAQNLDKIAAIGQQLQQPTQVNPTDVVKVQSGAAAQVPQQNNKPPTK